MKSILDMYAENYFVNMGLVEGTDVVSVRGAEPGLFVRASSRPDISVIIKAADNTDGDVATGEVKNDDNFTVKDAVMQEGAYLMLLLYWWKVFAGRDVSSVFGFVVCGPFCRDLKQRKRSWYGESPTDARHCICLLRLSAPQSLGDIPCLWIHKMVCLNDDVCSVDFLRLLPKLKSRVWHGLRRHISFPRQYSDNVYGRYKTTECRPSYFGVWEELESRMS